METLTIKEFVKRASNKHREKYDYSRSVYKNSYTPILILCPEHGDFYQRPHSHLLGKEGCGECARLKLRSWTEEEERFLVQNYKSKGASFCKESLKKSLASIRMKAGRLGIGMDRNTAYEEIPAKYLYDLHRNARRRNLRVKITAEFIWRLYLAQYRKCALTGWAIGFDTVSGVTASLDRIDSAKSYIEGNVQWVHKDVNLAKMDFPQEVFVKICRAVVKNFNG